MTEIAQSGHTGRTVVVVVDVAMTPNRFFIDRKVVITQTKVWLERRKLKNDDNKLLRRTFSDGKRELAGESVCV